MGHMKNLDNTYKLSTGKILFSFATTLCLMVPFLVGCLMFILASLPILCALPVLYMGSKLAALSLRLLKGTILERRERKYSTLSGSAVEISPKKN